MLQGNVRNDGKLWHNDVRRIPKAAHADFDDGIIHLFLGKIKEGHGGNDFKLGRLFAAIFEECINSSLGFFRHGSKILIGNINAVDGHTLIIFNKVGRRIARCLFPRSREDMGQVGSHAPLSVGSRYMDGPDLAFRVIQEFHKARDAFHTEMDAKFTKTFDILHRFVVVHDSPPVPLRQGPRQKARAGFSCPDPD